MGNLVGGRSGRVMNGRRHLQSCVEGRVFASRSSFFGDETRSISRWAVNRRTHIGLAARHCADRTARECGLDLELPRPETRATPHSQRSHASSRYPCTSLCLRAHARPRRPPRWLRRHDVTRYPGQRGRQDGPLLPTRPRRRRCNPRAERGLRSRLRPDGEGGFGLRPAGRTHPQDAHQW
jgi:hypothetical protein